MFITCILYTLYVMHLHPTNVHAYKIKRNKCLFIVPINYISCVKLLYIYSEYF